MESGFNNFFAPQPYHYMPNASSLPETYIDEQRHNGARLPQSEVFDSTAMFQDPYDTFRYDPTVIPTAEHLSLNTSIPSISHQESQSPNNSAIETSAHNRAGSVTRGLGERRSSSEEKDFTTPAQSKRKAQNRAAQRAFRERKERHVNELRAKLSAMESTTTNLASDNQRLKLALQRLMTENEFLRASSSSSTAASQGSSSNGHFHSKPRKGHYLHPRNPSFGKFGITNAFGSNTIDTSGERFDGRSLDDRSPVTGGGAEKASVDGSDTGSPAGSDTDYHTTPYGSGRDSSTRSPEPLLASNTLWDYIVEHPLVRSEQVDLADACDRLRRLAKPGKPGPVFHESEVREAIEQSRRGGGDALI